MSEKSEYDKIMESKTEITHEQLSIWSNHLLRVKDFVDKCVTIGPKTSKRRDIARLSLEHVCDDINSILASDKEQAGRIA